MKRIISVIMTIVLVLSSAFILTACGGGTGSGSGTEEVSAEELLLKCFNKSAGV